MRKAISLMLVVLAFTNFSMGQVKFKAVGDIMLGSKTPRTILPSNNGQVFVDSLGGLFDSVDFVFGNLEGVFVNNEVKPRKCSPESRAAGRCYEFGMPDKNAVVLQQLGFDVLSMDNNHNSDYGSQGVSHTKQTLDNLDIDYIAKKSPIVIEKDGVKYGFIAFGHSSISYHVAHIENTKKVISELDSRCDIVVVSFHGGAEGSKAQHVPNSTETYYGENRGNLVKFTHAAIDAGADVIFGHGPHVLRGLELYKGRLICYSLGNFLTYGNVSISGVKGLGAIVEVQLDNTTGEFQSGNICPTRQKAPGIPYKDNTKEAISVIRRLSSEDFPNSPLEINSDGDIKIKP